MANIQDPRLVRSVTIASATSISPLIDLEGYRPKTLIMSSGWDAINRMTFRVSDTTTLEDLYNTSGIEFSVASGVPLTSATGRALALDTALADALAGQRYMRIQSGPSSAAVNLTTGVTIRVVCVPL